MSQTFIIDFDDRKRQVRHYLAVVNKAEREAGLGSSRVQDGRLLTLRAGTFLILYNLVEASTRGFLEAIHDEIRGNQIPFHLLNPNLRSEVVRLFKRDASSGSGYGTDDFSSAFVSIALSNSIKLAGNVDAKMIREMSACYGFCCQTNTAITRDGSDLVTIKRNRNDLAHGRKTFEEVGRDHTASDLLLLARRAMRYMDGILKNVASYLDLTLYLEEPPSKLIIEPLSMRFGSLT